MHYTEFSPSPQLAQYIDAYWKVSGEETVVSNEVILPDGCVDIILAPSPAKILKYGIPYLDQFFLDRFSLPKHPLFPIIADIQQNHGIIPVEKLAKKHFITARQLERHFNQQLGVSPKEFCSFVRYQYSYAMIRSNNGGKSLHDIARECGYYDHSHLTHVIKKYTGSLPSQL